MRRLIAGDIHAHYDMLMKVLERASFDPFADVLYSVGDLTDRGNKPLETLRFLMSLPDFRPVLGNHDAWLEEYLRTGVPDPSWLMWDGGMNTVSAVSRLSAGERKAVGEWLSSFPAVRMEDDIIIIHGGPGPDASEEDLERLSRRRPPFPQDSLIESFLWDRSYLFSAMESEGLFRDDRIPEKRCEPLETHRTIFIGHTQLRPECVPFVSSSYHLVALDTGAGSGKGPLTVMDMGTGEYWQAEADGRRA